MKLIDKNKIRYTWMVDDDGERHDGVTLQSVIDKLPTVDAVEVVHGRWERENNRIKSYLHVCSVCGKIAYFCGVGCSYNYCPNCGAKMDGERKEK